MKAEYKLSLYVICFLLIGIGPFIRPTCAYEVTVPLDDINSATTIPPGNFRWLDVANQPFSQFIRENYDYTQADVTVTYEIVAGALQGELVLPAGNYKCKFILTEESFHSPPDSPGGYWAGAMQGNVNFTIISAP